MKRVKQTAKDGVGFWLPIVALTLFATVYGFIFAYTSFPKF